MNLYRGQKVKGQGHQADYHMEIKALFIHTNFKLGRRLQHALSSAMASYKGHVKLGYCTWAGAYRVGRTRDGHTTC